MNNEIYKRVKNNPKFSKYVKIKSAFAWKLSAIIFIVYYSFIMLIAFSPETLSKTISDYTITIGIPLGISIILLCIGLTALYVRRANGEFDTLLDEIKDDARFDA